MADVGKIIGQILASRGAQGLAGGLAGGLLTSKAGRKVGKKAIELGGLAAVGAIAWTAYDRWRRAQDAGESATAPIPVDAVAAAVQAGFLPAQGDAAEAEKLGLLLVRTMIAAARADGRLDMRETNVVFAAVEKLGLDPTDKAALLGELANPASIETIVAEANTRERAAEVYAAALLAIDTDTTEERAWLGELRERLGVPEGLATELEKRLSAGGNEPLRLPA